MNTSMAYPIEKIELFGYANVFSANVFSQNLRCFCVWSLVLCTDRSYGDKLKNVSVFMAIVIIKHTNSANWRLFCVTFV